MRNRRQCTDSQDNICKDLYAPPCTMYHRHIGSSPECLPTEHSENRQTMWQSAATLVDRASVAPQLWTLVYSQMPWAIPYPILCCYSGVEVVRRPSRGWDDIASTSSLSHIGSRAAEAFTVVRVGQFAIQASRVYASILIPIDRSPSCTEHGRVTIHGNMDASCF